jgi:hypothetical protein
MFTRASRCEPCRVLLVLLLACLHLGAPLGQAATNIGEISFIKLKADALPLDSLAFAKALNSSGGSLGDRLNSYSYVSGVGGVAFGAVAAGERGITVSGINYNPRLADGRRLQVTIDRNGKPITVTAPIPDWQLLPIARLAASDHDACFTLFGKLSDAKEQADRLARGEHILGFHSALQDTLLGWRLMQADLLIIRPDACQLPSEGGRYPLGLGEERWLGGPRPNVEANSRAYRELQNIVQRSPQQFHSYVICDHLQQVTFGVKGKELSLDGYPYWYCWRRKIDDPAAFQALQDTANQRANDLLNAERQRDRDQLNAAEFQSKWAGDYAQQRFGKLFDEIISANVLQPLPELSRTISASVQRSNGVNPVVYASLVTTMRYAALLRHARQANPTDFAQFVKSLEGVRVSPPVETPTIMLPGPNEHRAIVRP